MNYANFGLEKNVEILSAHHVERFTQLRENEQYQDCLLYTSPSPRDEQSSRMPSSA